MIKAVIFDVGGVLLTHQKNFLYRDMMKFFGMVEKEFLDVYYPTTADFMKGLISEEEFWKRFQKAAGTSKVMPKETMYKLHSRTGWDYNHQLIHFAKSLKDKHLKIAILSNVVQPIVDFMKGEKFYEHFDEVVLSCEVGMKKPDKEIYLHTLKLLQVKPSEAVFIDDMERNVKVAEEVGMKGIVFKRGEQFIKDFRIISAKPNF